MKMYLSLDTASDSTFLANFVNFSLDPHNVDLTVRVILRSYIDGEDHLDSQENSQMSTTTCKFFIHSHICPFKRIYFTVLEYEGIRKIQTNKGLYVPLRG
jgi:hypothetical protein